MYAIGNSYRDISDHIKEMYDTEISPSVLVKITNRVIPQIESWQKRLLDKVYPILWLDAMVFKVKEEGIVKHKCLYNILALTAEGKKEILGMYLAETEGAKLWLQILTDLQNRGVEDVLSSVLTISKDFQKPFKPFSQKQKYRFA